MTDPSKNRRLTLTRKKEEPSPPEDPRDAAYEIPRASKAEIRHLIEVEALGSPTEIAARLNADGFPCAQAEAWSAKLVDSALRRQDMLDLRERLKDNRGAEEPAPMVTPEDMRRAAFDGAKEALDKIDLKLPEVKIPEIKLPEFPPLKVDTFTIKETVIEAVDKTLKEHLRHFEAADRASAAEIVTGVREALKTSIATAFASALPIQDITAMRRTTDATSRNVGDILKRIDVVCEDLHDTITKSFVDHRVAVANNCESMALQLCDQVDKRLAVLETTLVAKFSSHGAIDSILARVVDARLKAHLDGAVNQFAVMVERMKRDLRNDRDEGRR